MLAVGDVAPSPSSRRGEHDRSDCRCRDRSLENIRLRGEVKTMMARLSALEHKSRATSIPVHSRENVGGFGGSDESVTENTHDKSSSRRRQTRLLGRDTSRSPDCPVLHSVRHPLQSHRILSSHVRYTTSRPRDHVLPTREDSQHRRSRSRSPRPRRSSEVGASVHSFVNERIVDVIRSINNAGRFSQHFYISNFDPNLHKITDWCAEVDRAQALNNWNDFKCLSRIGNRLKGEACLWLNEWVTSDCTWSNFKKDFRLLCPKTPDIAGY